MGEVLPAIDWTKERRWKNSACARPRNGTENNNSELNNLATMYYKLLLRKKPENSSLRRSSARNGTIYRGKHTLSPLPPKIVPANAETDIEFIKMHFPTTPEPKKPSRLLTITPKNLTRKSDPLCKEKSRSLVKCGYARQGTFPRTPIPEMKSQKLIPNLENYYQRSARLRGRRSELLQEKKPEPRKPIERKATRMPTLRPRTKLDIDLSDLPRLEVRKRRQSAMPWSVESSVEIT